MQPLYTKGSLGEIPAALVPGSEGDGGIAEWQELFAAQASLSTNHLVIVDGANHVSLGDRQEHALQPSTDIRQVVEAVRLDEPLH